MIQKLQHKFILIMMTIVTILLAAIFVSLYLTSRFNYEQQCIEDLRTAARINDSRQSDAGKAQEPRQDNTDSGREPSARPEDDPLPGSDAPPVPGEASRQSERPDEPEHPANVPDAPSDTPALPQDSPSGLLPGEDERALMIVDRMQDGSLNVVRNQLYRFEQEDAEQLVALADETGTSMGVLADQHLRYLWEPRGPQQVTRYVFADTLSEEISLRAQMTNSVIIGIIAFALFLLCSILLARWITAPVEDAWNRQQQFVADASHELKTPLTVILANVNLLQTSPLALAPENAVYVEHIHAEADRMKELIESLLTLARSDSGHSQTVFEPLDFSYLVTNSTLTFEPVAFEQGKTITGEIENGLMVMGDKTRLRRLIDILLDNACKYSDSGSEIRADLTRCPPRKHSAEARTLLLTVTSEGTPLKKEEIDRVFLRFYRADPSRATIPGYGLGLPIAQAIAEEHGGEIQAFSDGVNKNTFCVQLPLYRKE